MNPAGIYRRRHAGPPPDPHLAMLPSDWLVYFNVDDSRNAEEIAAALRVQETEIAAAIDRLLELDLIEERPISLGEFLRSKSTYEHHKSGRPVPLSELARREDAAAALPEAQDQYTPSGGSAPSYREAQDAEPFEPLEPPTMGTTENRSVSLLRLMDYIMSHSSDRTSGQLAVYRVFMGINTGLLRRNGITSLRFTEDRVVNDPELLGALSESLQRALGLPFPEDAYV